MSEEFEKYWNSDEAAMSVGNGLTENCRRAFHFGMEAVKPRWIPVRDFYPEIGKEVLIKSPKLRPIALTYQIFPFQRFINQTNGYWYFSEEIEWMELPE